MSLVAEGARELEDGSVRLATARCDEEEEETLKKLSQSKLKWGATSLVSDLAEVISEESGNPVMHLSFGGESTNVMV
ncbi:hypothetical protein Daesc_009997 [Daldinia eschscholtzii]|uniref:Uncharacterized protein n=1 Tax=Daldinia eschscholtzii TaxID=292717 RepID=A0AAX6M705_9PEZI